MTKGKNKKRKITKISLFVLPPLPSQHGGGGGGGLLQSPFSNFFHGKNFFIDTWLSGQRGNKLTEWQSWQKIKKGMRENTKGGGLQQPPPPALLRERVNRSKKYKFDHYTSSSEIPGVRGGRKRR